MSLTLPTPSEFSTFPYKPPYSIQVDLMKHVYHAIENRKVAIVESPTGTGKTLSLLCASLTWLSDEKDRALRGKLAALQVSLAGGDEPDWVLEQTLERHRRELQVAEEEFAERLAKAKRREEAQRKMENARVNKKAKLEHIREDDVSDDEIFLPDALEMRDDDDNLSPAVKELMQKLGQPHSTTTGIPQLVQEEGCTKIYYASRTHSQLSQLLPELRKLDYSIPITDIGGVDDAHRNSDTRTATRLVPLGSRAHLCINEPLRNKASNLDEACRELLSEKGDRRCPHLPRVDETSRMLDLRDQILASPKDIEDLVATGKAVNTCPYFGSRRAIPQAQVVSLPYNLLLHKTARDALGINVKDNIVIIDEAHNLIDTILHLHRIDVASSTLRISLQQLSIYWQRFRTRLSGVNALHLKRLMRFLKAMDVLLAKWRENIPKPTQGRAEGASQEEVMTVSDFVQRLGSGVDGINLIEIETYLRSSKIARKVSSYSDRVAKKALKDARGVEDVPSQTPALHSIESLLLALTNEIDDGRITLTLVNRKGDEQVHVKYQHLNPSTHFQELVDAARCVVLAGGTMSPISDVTMQLFNRVPADRLSNFACGHVIPTRNLQCLVVGKGPSGKELQLRYSQRGDKTILEEVGQILSNFVNIVPHGMVVFFPSYSFLEAVRSVWSQNGLLTKLNAKKTLFFEPRESSETDTVLRNYALAVGTKAPMPGQKGGALLFAVVGAKLSEGLNFSDDLARAVVIIGLPFANLGSAELKERMKYVNEIEKRLKITRKIGAKDAGAELYENLCMKAVNQSIGRAIRHRNDWSSLILIDSRYGSPRIRSKLPQWIGQGVIITQGFGQAIKSLSDFYRDKRDVK